MTACTLCPRTAPDHEHLCLVHSGELRGWLAEIPAQARLLDEFLTPAGAPAEGRLGGTGRAHSPAPVDLRILTLLGPGHYDPAGPDDDGTAPIRVLLGAWAGHIAYLYPAATRDPHGIQRTQPCEQAWPSGGETIDGWCDWLAAYLPYALTLPLAAELHTALDTLVRRLRDLTHTRPHQHPRSAPCPACDLCTLVSTDGQWGVRCLGCGHQMTPDEYDQHAAAILHTHQLTAR
ncbi:hypothetical protein [Streptomyces fuscichromogenes]|uniref:Uncharacterized protein n=1 Tax=Streptomyces fuscichromogenes TaxID=1324013 RepID=A0A917XPQ7_9ACTN|nr:hypothetical protein [Streptomyces fuscichromogenes]GGN47526.1 hypothetical protein GCM10011578_101130 [Streptomyces fuscichromogenes]